MERNKRGPNHWSVEFYVIQIIHTKARHSHIFSRDCISFFLFNFILCDHFAQHFSFRSALGDEILVVNGKSLQGMKHDEAINVFKSIKSGDVVILIGRRLPKNRKTTDSIETTSTIATAVLTKNE